LRTSAATLRDCRKRSHTTENNATQQLLHDGILL
jgi:hypothetical protein